jgi:hypothetical protein
LSCICAPSSRGWATRMGLSGWRSSCKKRGIGRKGGREGGRGGW